MRIQVRVKRVWVSKENEPCALVEARTVARDWPWSEETTVSTEEDVLVRCQSPTAPTWAGGSSLLPSGYHLDLSKMCEEAWLLHKKKIELNYPFEDEETS